MFGCSRASRRLLVNALQADSKVRDEDNKSDWSGVRTHALADWRLKPAP